jgi:putative MATE family efflux protein
MADSDTSTKKTQHRGVATLLGNPRSAIIRLSLPMIVAMSVQSLYNLADKIWVSGLGKAALSATGLYFPFMMLAIAISVGLGIGGGSAISRFIGAGNKENANSVAVHTIVFAVALAVIYSVPLYVFAEPIFHIMGAGEALEMSLDYGRVMILGSVFIFLANIGNSFLRSEGNAKAAMFAMLTGTILNVLLDPLFIYNISVPLPFLSPTTMVDIGLDLGVAGAAYATILSFAVSCGLLAYWLLVKKNNYIQIHLKNFRFRGAIARDIFRVGFPSTLSQGSMSLMMLLLNLIITAVAGYVGVAIFQTGWTVVSIAILPLLGIASAVTAVSGATYGAGYYVKLKQAFLYAVKFGFVIELGIALLTLVFAPYITHIFTLSEDTKEIVPDITHFLRIVWLFYPAVAGGMLSSALFQGVGKGLYSFIITIIRTLGLTALGAYIFSIGFEFGLEGIYIGIIIGSWCSSIIAFTWANMFINRKLKAAT